MRVLNPFGPKIAVTKIPSKIINRINKEVDLIVNNRSRLKKSDYSKKLVGQVKQEIRLPNSFVNKYLIKFNFGFPEILSMIFVLSLYIKFKNKGNEVTR